jgi:voltage-gated potassium channel
MEGVHGRLLGGFAGLVVVLGAGSGGYYLLGDGRWSMIDCLYMTVITLTTVGYNESLPGFHEVPYTREYTILLITTGIGTFLYFASNLTANIIEGDLRGALRKTRMRKQITKLRQHVIVCGAGTTGKHVMKELIVAQVPTVAIDLDVERLESLEAEFKHRDFRYIVGDATDDATLQEAGLENARGLCAALANDKDNLYLVVTTRQVNSTARIVARGSALAVLDKLKRAGADAVVSPNYIGGLRMVSELIRPQVVAFLDEMLRSEDLVRIDEVEIVEGSAIAGKKLRDAGIAEDREVQVLAVKEAAGYEFSPSSDFSLQAGMILVVLGPMDRIIELRARIAP